MILEQQIDAVVPINSIMWRRGTKETIAARLRRNFFPKSNPTISV